MNDRSRYHHGDVHRQMVQAAVELARESGPAGVVLREVARRVGVSAAAAYRHFGSLDDLLAEVAEAARVRLDTAMAEQLELSGAAAERNPAVRLRAIGRGYLTFALAEPGLFRIAFVGGSPPPGAQPWEVPAAVVEAGPYARLLGALRGLAEAGRLRDDTDVDSAALDAWSTIHGLSELLLGPRRFLVAEQREAAIDRVLDFVVHGITRADERA